MAKKSEFNPKPLDSDNDGLVQEGTEFERPVEPEFATEADFAASKAVIEAATIPESHVEPVEAVKPLRKVNTFFAMPGDSYASLAAQLCPEGMTKHEYAKLLFALNNGKALIPGTEVKLG